LPCFVPTSPDREFDMALAEFVLNKKYPGRVMIVQATSQEFFDTVVGQPLEFVYIDGLHDNVSLMNDIREAWGRLKPGGVGGGHDYAPGDPRSVADISLIGVALVVNWWAVTFNVRLHITDEPIPSWYFQKPQP